MKKVEITEQRYHELLNAEKRLIALESAGVDNWEGYEFVMECLEEE